MRIKTYVINLPESTDRRKRMEEETANYLFMNVEWIEAVNGKALTEEETEQLFDRKEFASLYSRPSTPGEIGCTLSHRKCYEALLASDEEVVLILEDDASVACPDELEQVISDSIQLLKKRDTEIIQFTSMVCYFAWFGKKVGSCKAYTVYETYLAHAYLINRRGAERILRKCRPGIVADDFKQIRKLGVRIRCVIPNVVVQEQGMDSVIGYERWKKPMIYTKKCLPIRVWKFVIYRMFRTWRNFFFKRGWIVCNNIYGGTEE